MKKYIIIMLSIISITLLGIYLYMNIEEKNYREQFKIEKEENNDKPAIEMKKISNEGATYNTLISELEDLTAPEYYLYNLVPSDYLDREQKKEKNIYIDADFEIDIRAKNNFTVIDEFFSSINATHFYNNKGNVLGTIFLINKEYNEDNLTDLFMSYKENDSASMEMYTNYNFGNLNDITFNGYKGIYNRTEYSEITDEVTKPVEYRYIAYFDYKEKIICVHLSTYKNCSYGFMSLNELLDTAIEFL